MARARVVRRGGKMWMEATVTAEDLRSPATGELGVVRIAGTLEAISPIHHGGDEKTGSTPVLRSITHWDPLQGRHVRLPFISGNAIRGRLRRLVMRDLCDRLGVDELAPKLHHALFSGGVLESTDEGGGVLELEWRRRIRATIPPLGLFGCSLANQMIRSSLRVAHAFPVCAERRAYLPEALASDPRAQHSVRTFTDVAFATRRDDLRAEREAGEQAVQMKVDFEAFIPGTLFVHGFAVEYGSPEELACLGHAIALWERHPAIGGKDGSGYGELRLHYHWVPDAAPYLRYVEENADAIRTALGELGERVGG